MLSTELEIAIQVAAGEAQVRRHEFFGLEHMLGTLDLDGSCARRGEQQGDSGEGAAAVHGIPLCK